MENDEIPKAEARAGLPQCRTSPYHILVVDDEPSMRKMNAKMLMDSGYHVDAVEDGAAAWDSLQRTSYDLLITDNNMPKVTGVELVKRVHEAGMNIPVIMATGTLPEEAFNALPGFQHPATLLKPYTMAEFLDTVKKVLCAIRV